MSRYTLWIPGANNLVGSFATEDEALGWVRELLDTFSDAFANELQLGGTDDADQVLPFVSGAALAKRVRMAVHLAGSRIG